MRVFVKLLTLSLLLAGLLLTSTGCPDSDPIAVGNSEFSFMFSAGSPSGRWVDGAADTATITVRNVGIEPLDPLVAEALGTTSVDILQDNFVFNFKNGQGTLVDQRLPAGTYRISTIQVTGITFSDFGPLDPANFSDPMNPTCEDFVRSYSLSNQANITPFNLGDILVQIGPDGSSFTIEWNWPQLVSALQQSQTCSASCVCPGNFDPMNPNDPGPLACTCSTGSFNRGTFRNLAPQYLTFTSN